MKKQILDSIVEILDKGVILEVRYKEYFIKEIENLDELKLVNILAILQKGENSIIQTIISGKKEILDIENSLLQKIKKGLI